MDHDPTETKDISSASENSFSLHRQVSEVDLVEIFRILLKYKLTIFISIVIAATLGSIYTLIATPIYRAEALLYPVSQEKNSGLGSLANQFGGLASIAGIESNSTDIEVALATLRSRSFLIDFIAEENLMQILYKEKWDDSSDDWKDSDDIPTLWKGYKRLISIMELKKDKNTGLINLSLDWKDAQIASSWVSMLILRVNSKLRQEAIQDAEESIEYLKAALKKTSIIEIKESIYNLIEAQTKTMMLANTKEEYAFKIIDTPIAHNEKVKPKSSIIIILCILSGLIIGVLIALYKHTIYDISPH